MKHKNMQLVSGSRDSVMLVTLLGHVREILSKKSWNVLNGHDVSDINHGTELYSNFMSFSSEQVTERIESFFSSRLDHTGLKPPVNLQADKGTNVHRTRQLHL